MNTPTTDKRNQATKIVKNIRRVKKRRNPEDVRIWVTGRTNSGVFITPDNAITISAVWAAISYLSQTIAMLPWTINATVKGGMEERESNPVNNLLRRRPSFEYSSYQFRETLMHWALRWGNGYAEIERDIAGRPIAMHPIHPSQVTVYRDPEDGSLFYEVAGDNERVILDPMDIFHLRGFGESVVGVNVMMYASESLGWAKATQLFGAGFFGNGANPSGVITMKRPMSKKGMENLRKEFAKLYGGPDNGNSVAILDNEMDYRQLSTSPDNGQFLQTNQFQVEEICRWFGVPPHKVYHLLRTSFNSIEHQSIEVVTDSLMPWERRFCDEADFKLLGQNRSNLFSKMDFNHLLRGDTATRTAYYTAMRNTGSINTNEIRKEEGRTSIGPDGDKYLVQSQYTTLEQIGQEPEPNPIEPDDQDPNEDENEETEENEIVDQSVLDYAFVLNELKEQGYVS